MCLIQTYKQSKDWCVDASINPVTCELWLSSRSTLHALYTKGRERTNARNSFLSFGLFIKTNQHMGNLWCPISLIVLKMHEIRPYFLNLLPIFSFLISEHIVSSEDMKELEQSTHFSTCALWSVCLFLEHSSVHCQATTFCESCCTVPPIVLIQVDTEHTRAHPVVSLTPSWNQCSLTQRPCIKSSAPWRLKCSVLAEAVFKRCWFSCLIIFRGCSLRCRWNVKPEY